jgi:hypothetical protein
MIGSDRRAIVILGKDVFRNADYRRLQLRSVASISAAYDWQA